MSGAEKSKPIKLNLFYDDKNGDFMLHNTTYKILNFIGCLTKVVSPLV